MAKKKQTADKKQQSSSSDSEIVVGDLDSSGYSVDGESISRIQQRLRREHGRGRVVCRDREAVFVRM